MIDLKNHQTEEFDFPVMIFDINLKSPRPITDEAFTLSVMHAEHFDPPL